MMKVVYSRDNFIQVFEKHTLMKIKGLKTKKCSEHKKSDGGEPSLFNLIVQLYLLFSTHR